MKTLKLFFACFLVIGLLGMSAQAAIIMVPGDYATIQEAIDEPATVDGDIIMVGVGVHAGAMVDKAVTILGAGDETSITPSVHLGGPFYSAFYISDVSGAEISNLKIECEEPEKWVLAVFARGAYDITISHLTIINPTYGIYSSGGSGWTITHNTISGLNQYFDEGKGIYIYGHNVYGADAAKGFLISFNNITADVDSGWAYFGIYIDTPGFFCEPEWDLVVPIEHNKIVQNTVAVYGVLGSWEDFGVSWFVSGLAIVDWKAYCGQGSVVVRHNLIKFNDFLGSTVGIIINPEELLTHPEYSNLLIQNLGALLQVPGEQFKHFGELKKLELY